MGVRHTAAHRHLTLAFLGACLVLASLSSMGGWSLWMEEGTPPGNLLDGCHHVYLDMGTNTGE